MNLILNTDSYKFTHYKQNPPGTTVKYSYIEARGGAFGYVVNFGLQAFLMGLEPIWYEDYRAAEALIDQHMGPGIFDKDGWQKLLKRHSGLLPLEIDALPEGVCVPHGTPLVQVHNTDPEFPWLPAFIETALLRSVWYPSTVATLSRECKVLLKSYLARTSDNPAAVDFMLHDFGARGVSSLESAGLGGMAHLVNFKGTDTVEALRYAAKYYGEPCAGFSIPASEHSTVTCWGKGRETEFVRHMLRTFGGENKLVAVVGDSYDIFAFAGQVVGEELREEIKATGGRLIVRPDSGDPVEVVSEVMRLLMAKHGSVKNSKGYHVLPDHVRVIQGDGVDLGSIDGILGRLEQQKISAENLAFGMGGALLQKLNRDTCRFAMKTSAAKINDEWVDVCKNPVTDKGKVSKAGVFDVVNHGNNWVTLRRPYHDLRPIGLLRPVWANGYFVGPLQTFTQVRANAEKGLDRVSLAA